MSTLSRHNAALSTANSSSGYRTLWRWHFYAGLFVMPLLIALAITGTLYCFQPQIEPLLYPQLLVVEPQTAPRMTEDALLARARAAMPSNATAVTAAISNAPDRSTEFIFRLADGEKQSVYLNPYNGAVLGTLSVDYRFMQVDRMLHRKLLLGKPGELLMELAACWTLVMIGTGVALWWPRGATRVQDALVPRFTLKGRPLWKNVHAVMGIWLALGDFRQHAIELPPAPGASNSRRSRPPPILVRRPARGAASHCARCCRPARVGRKALRPMRRTPRSPATKHTPPRRIRCPAW